MILFNKTSVRFCGVFDSARSAQKREAERADRRFGHVLRTARPAAAPLHQRHPSVHLWPRYASRMLRGIPEESQGSGRKPKRGKIKYLLVTALVNHYL